MERNSNLWHLETMVGKTLCDSVVAKTNLTWGGGSSKVFPSSRKFFQGFSKVLQEGPPRCPQGIPRRPQGLPRRPQGPPRRPQGLPKAFPRPPKASPRPPQASPRASDALWLVRDGKTLKILSRPGGILTPLARMISNADSTDLYLILNPPMLIISVLD